MIDQQGDTDGEANCGLPGEPTQGTEDVHLHPGAPALGAHRDSVFVLTIAQHPSTSGCAETKPSERGQRPTER